MRARSPLAAWVAVVAGLVVFAAACGSGTEKSPEEVSRSGTAAAFIEQVTTAFSQGQAGRLWDVLAPADQAVVTRARYMSCQGNEGFAIKKMKLLATYSDPISVAGVEHPATAVSLRVTSEDGVTTATMHAVRSSGTWRWVLSDADYAAYRAGKCPAHR
jgi:hypothetical protein